MKIGVTVNDTTKIWTNGLNQNTYFLIKMLKMMKYDVVPLMRKTEDQVPFLLDLPLTELTSQNCLEFDLILEAAFMIDSNIVKRIKNAGKKIVSISYGNSLFYLMESLISKPDITVGVNREGVETWISPHYEFSKQFIESSAKCTVKILPYIWEPWFIDGTAKAEYKVKNLFNNTIDKRNVFCVEPNISIAKTCLAPLLIIEDLYRRNPAIINSFRIFGSKLISDNQNFLNILNNTDIFMKKRVVLEQRHSIVDILNTGKVGTFLSNHYYNDLNYVTLEALYLNYPIVHNSKFCKEAGYYYNNQDLHFGSEQLEIAITQDNNFEKEYIEKSKKVIYDFSINNQNVQNIYYNLINNIR